MSAPTELKKGLSQRHLTMIAIGGVIGAGLFVGSGVVINDAGPGAFLSYGLTGLLIILVMRMLGEMATANPSTGSFSDYARTALGGWAGFSVAWLYWYFWVIVVGFEAVAGAKILQFWVDLPLWLLSLVLMVLMTVTNLFSVSSYGEFEFWFAGIKVAAIVAFIVLGALYVFGLWKGHGLSFANLTVHGGFFPKGVGAIFSAIVVVIFSMVGAEIATIAAAESEDPERAIAKATNSVVLRILVFFVGSVFLLCTILPWNSNELGSSPYVSALKEMGIPGADQVMNAVVLTAVLSCLNSGLYTASRMLFVLAARREAPVRLIAVNGRGVPMTAILTSTVVGFICVVASAIFGDVVFTFLLNTSGAIILFVYGLICVSQIVLRRRTPVSQLKVKMWFFPWLSYVAVLAIVGVLIGMLLDEAARSQLILSLLSWALVLVLYVIMRRMSTPEEPSEEHVAAVEAASAAPVERVLIMANETLEADELMEAVKEIDPRGAARYFVTVPANPVDTGQADHQGAVYIWDATVQAAQDRLDRTLAILDEHGVSAEGELGDYRPSHALAVAVARFEPDRLIISTKPEETSVWLGEGVVSRARRTYALPLTHIVAEDVPQPAG